MVLSSLERVAMGRWCLPRSWTGRHSSPFRVHALSVWQCRYLEWGRLEARVNQDNSVDVREVTTDAREHLEFHDRVIKASLGWGHLIVTTSTQAYIYKSANITRAIH